MVREREQGKGGRKGEDKKEGGKKRNKRGRRVKKAALIHPGWDTV